LYGNAATASSKIIDANALTNYIKVSFAADKILKQQKHKQTPVIAGNPNYELAKIDPQKSRFTAKRTDAAVSTTGLTKQWSTLKSLPVQPLDYVAKLLEAKSLDSMFNFDALLALPARELYLMVTDSLRQGLSPAGVDSLNKLVLQLSKSPAEVARFNERFATLISDHGQQTIEAYLKGDEAELDKRSYYNASRKSFDRYVTMYDVAIKLLPPRHYLRRSMLVDREYFAGVLERLKINTVADGQRFTESALAQQRKAMALEPYAPYIHNEMAQVLFAKGQFDSAVYHFKVATDLSPTWALPWANLVGLYNMKRDFVNARRAAAKARALQPDMSVLLVNEAVTEELEKNYLKAEGLYLQGIKANNLHYLPFERLGVTYAATARYARADSFFYAASTRKQGYYFQPPSASISAMEIGTNIRLAKWQNDIDSCWFTMQVDKANPDANLLILAPMQHWIKGLYPMADTLFRAAIALQPRSFLLNHYYGKFLMELGAGLVAEPFLLQAKQAYQSADTYSKQLLDVESALQQYADKNCYRKLLSGLHYARAEDDFLLAKLYQQKGYYAEAETALRRVIATDTATYMLGAFHMLAVMQMFGKNYHAAEQTWMEYMASIAQFLPRFSDKNSAFWKHLNVSKGSYELEQFYQTACAQNPDSAYWYKKAAWYWKRKILQNPSAYTVDVEETYGLPLMDFDAEEDLFHVRFSRYARLPLQNQQIDFRAPVHYPFETGLQCLRRAAALATDDESIVDLNFALAQFYQLINRHDSAALCLAKALDIEPTNASLRGAIYRAQRDNFDFMAAYMQLDTLYQNSQLRPAYFLNYIDMAICSGNYSGALQLLESPAATNLPPANSKAPLYLRAKLYCISASPNRAIRYIMDSVPNAANNADDCYTLAILYTKDNQPLVALQWLQKALSLGFRYGYLLRADPALSTLRAMPQWKEMMEKQPTRFTNYEAKTLQF
jgi:tetratricopeptide (TPR) repeat protein